jgi:hypothetical protein
MTPLSLSRHASLRASQRGVTNGMLQALIDNADYEAAVGGGCIVLRLSRQGLSYGACSDHPLIVSGLSLSSSRMIRAR